MTLVTASEHVPEVNRVSLDPAECRRDFETVAERDARVRALFAGHRCCDVAYEDLVRDDDASHRELCRFLGVRPMALTTGTKRIISRPLQEMIRNYDELKAHFEATPYAGFFDDDAPRENREPSLRGAADVP